MQLTHDTMRSLTNVPKQLKELERLLETNLRKPKLSINPTAADVAAAREALEDTAGRIRPALNHLLEVLERLREGFRKDQLRRAFATALVLRSLDARVPGSPQHAARRRPEGARGCRRARWAGTSG
jgi:hypothetical protein